MNVDQEIRAHYDIADLEQRVLRAVAQAGKDIDALTVEDLSLVDEFHIGGREGTHDLLSQFGIEPGARLLDIGSGIGGPARHVAERFACHVTGVDLTPRFVEVATSLSQRLGLADRLAFHCGSALELPFPEDSFDGAYMLHVGMNIPDKATLFAEVRRVLRPQGFFALFDIMQMKDGALQFPVPWAASAEGSFLATADAYRQALEQAGLTVIAERNRHAFALEFFRRIAEASAMAKGPVPNAIAIINGEIAAQAGGNVRASLMDGLIAPVEIIARRA